MKIIMIKPCKYTVLGKYFNTIEEAEEYEKSISSNIKLRARNLYLFYKLSNNRELAEELLTNVISNRRLSFGQYKNNPIVVIICSDYNYIKWCIDNIKSFQLTDKEQILFDTDSTLYLGGTGFDSFGDSFSVPGEYYDFDLINWEIENVDSKR